MDNSHTIHRGDAAPGIRLTCVGSDKFKTGSLSLYFIGALRRETATLNALLPSVLRRGSKEHPDMGSIAAALDDLYGASIDPVVRKKGEIHCTGFCASFPDDRYLTDAGSQLEETVGLLRGMLVSPDMRDGLLRADYVESERQVLADDIRASIIDKRVYCFDRLVEEMCAGEAYGVSRIGYEDDALAITPQTLTAHYEETIAYSSIELLYIGCAEPSRVNAALQPLLRALPGRKDAKPPKTEVLLQPPHGAPRRFSEELAISQSKFTIGFRLGDAMLEPNYMAMLVFNALFGGSATSKLFVNVRERLALCYYVGSRVDKHKGIAFVSSGVEFENIDAATGEIHNQLDEIKRGNVSEWELTSAKRAVLSNIAYAMDSVTGLEEMYFDSFISEVPYDPKKLYAETEAVTLQNVVDIASGIAMDSIFVLTPTKEA
jgi:predicted Zn-dependent peptidase